MSQNHAAVPLNLDTACGASFTYRDLIECGETWHGLENKVANRPYQEQTVRAMEQLAVLVLDPLVKQFEVLPHLTYGLACAELARRVPGGIAPRIDQHAGYELNAKGQPLCSRGGLAVDFLVPGRSSREVAVWLIANTPFDRLYFYGDQRPIHISIGPKQSRLVVEMGVRADGRRGPVRRGHGGWLAVDSQVSR